MNFICKQCNKKTTVNDFQEIVRLEKICSACHKHNVFERANQARAEQRRIVIENSPERECSYCKKKFKSYKAKYCSQTCYRKEYHKLHYKVTS